jgi:hypothetical protein
VLNLTLMPINRAILILASAGLGLLCLVGFGLGLHFHENVKRTETSSAGAILDVYAKRVAEFSVLSNTIPSTAADIDEYVLHGADTEGTGSVRYRVVDTGSRRFVLSRQIDSRNWVTAEYQIGTTGLVHITKSVEGR